MHADLDLHVPNVWQHVREVRSRVSAALVGLRSELRDATEMAASELVENAIKYGEAVPGCADVRVSLRVSETDITVQITNGVLNPGSLHRLQARIDEINAAASRESLYLGRLQQLMERPEESGNLGLYRIAFEGRFDLSYSLSGAILTVTASRTLESRTP